MSTQRWFLGAAGLLALAAVGLVSCFSERSTIAGTDDGELIECGGIQPSAAVLAAAARSASGLTPAAATGSARVVAIRNFAFHPDTVTITPGMTVVWVNCEERGIDSHTTTADGELWSSDLLAPGDVYAFTFEEAGAFGYHCIPHPSMRGAVIVEE
ncbi:MAG TPA: plastocyanin/azurin family copper-binding protein [Longimicrobiales bacterium]